MAILFLINTPAQAMNAALITTMYYQNVKCDAYYTPNVTRELKSFKKDGVFDNIYKICLVDDILPRSNVVFRSIVRIKNAIDIKKILNNLPSNAMEYSRVFISGVSLRNCEYYYAIKSINKNVSISLYEEGICEYYELGVKKNYAKILFSYLFFGRYYLSDCDSVYVHRPEFVQNIWNDIAIKKIPSFCDSVECIETINRAFSYSLPQMKNITGKFIFIEQAFSREEDEKKQLELIQLLISLVGQENVIIKLHPRSKQNKYVNIKIMDTKVPLEIIGLNENVCDNIYISIVSSAIANFKLMLDIEPKTIMLYDIMGSKINSNTRILFKRLQNSYINSLFFVPKTKEEYINQVKLLNDENKIIK